MISGFHAAIDPVVVFERAFGVDALEWQLPYLREQRNTILLKGRQIGASLGAAALAIHLAVYRPNALAAIVSPTQKQSSEITTRARAGLRNLGERLVQDSASLLRLRNGSRILSLPGTPTSVRGWSAQLLIIDEAAFVLHETFTAVRAVIATGGRLVVQSTPAAEVGDFHELVTADDPGWAHFTVRSDSVSTISGAFLEGERRAMSPDAYAAEYECQFGRAAIGLFTADRLAKLILPEAPGG